MKSKAFETDHHESDDFHDRPWAAGQMLLTPRSTISHALDYKTTRRQKLGFQGARAKGRRHFSQFAQLCERLWGKSWFRGAGSAAFLRTYGNSLL